MGLDQYAYAAGKTAATVLGEGREIAYWRKHPNLHGWMEALWAERNPAAQEQTSFNGIELELTWEDLERLEQDVLAGTLPVTTGFFFGSAADDHYRDYDLQFIRNAKAEVFVGLKMFYNSSW